MKKTVLVGMSGGVDSSVSAALLVRQGYTVVGGFIKNWSDSKDLWTGECQWRGERRDAMRVAAKLGIPLLTFDFEESYRKAVVGELFRGYEAGETPNPDVLCNEYIKFGLFADEAKRLGFDFIATGHYARVQGEARDPSRHSGETFGPALRRGDDEERAMVHLLRGLDPDKDQSYFLYRVPQDVLRRTLFPIGDLKKSAVRELAKEMDLPVAEKPDSQGICFIGKLDMAEFLRKKIPSKPGEVIDEHGEVIGRHDGLDAYTVGQRHRILVEKKSSKLPETDQLPYYVAKKDAKKNQLVVVQGADHPWLYASVANIKDLHWTRGIQPTFPFECEVQVRYRQAPIRATCSLLPEHCTLRFAEPVKAVAPGQSAVIYVGDECLGGGVIE